MPGNFYDKFPDEIREFDFDASSVLINGDTISSVDAVSLSAGFLVLSSSFVGSIVTLRVGGGEPGSVAFAVANLHLASGQLRQGPLCVLIKPLPGA